MSSNKVRTVDFLPKKDLLGNVKKISESDVAEQNSRILPIINLLCMEKGTNFLFPDMGLHNVLTSIPYTEMNVVYSILEIITSHIKEYTGYEVNVHIDEDKSDLLKGYLEIAIEVEGVLSPIGVNVKKNDFIRIKHPSLFI
jgi:hypothetical protein